MVQERRDPPAIGTARRLRERLPGALLALVGVLLALPTVFWPTSIFTYSDPAREVVPDPNLDGQRMWSWGKSAQISQGEQLGPLQENVLGLWLLVALLLLGLAGALLWVVHDGLQWSLIGVATTALVAGRVLTAVVERLGNSLSDFYSDAGNGVRIYMTPAGSAEVVSAAVLVLALAVMLFRPLVAVHRTVSARLPGTSGTTEVAGQAAVETPSGNKQADGPTVTRPSLGRALLGDAVAGGPVVGFSEDSDDPDDLDRRFRPRR